MRRIRSRLERLEQEAQPEAGIGLQDGAGPARYPAGLLIAVETVPGLEAAAPGAATA